MTMRIIIAAYTIIHIMIMCMMMMPHAERAVRIVVVVPIAVIPIQERIYAIVWTPPTWPIAPIIWRVPTNPRCSPKPIINQWSIDIYWFDDIIGTIDILVAHHLHSNLVIGILLDEDRCHILIDILSQYGLDDHKVAVVIGSLDDAQIVHFSIAIEVEVGECRVWIIEQLLKLLQVFGLSKEGCYGLEIEVFRYIGRSGSDSHRLVCQSSIWNQKQGTKSKDE